MRDHDPMHPENFVCGRSERQSALASIYLVGTRTGPGIDGRTAVLIRFLDGRDPMAEPSAAGRALAKRRWAGTSPEERTEALRANALKGSRAFNQRFTDMVDPDRQLDAEERDRLAAEAKSAYFTELARRSAAARRARADARQGGQAA